jgi:hypothetical protein
MIGIKAGLLAAGMVLGLGAAPASAAAVFSFAQTGAVPGADLAFSGALSVSDQAYAEGFDIAYGNSDPGPAWQSGLDQLVSLLLDFNNLRGFNRTLTEQNFYAPRSPGSQGRSYAFHFTGTAGGGLQGMVRFNDTEDQFSLDLGPLAGSGLFISDRGGPVCGRAPGCGFTFGTLAEATAVPESASLSLFGTGLLILAGVTRRRRRPRPA